MSEVAVNNSPPMSKWKAYMIIGLVLLVSAGVALGMGSRSKTPTTGTAECHQLQAAAASHIPNRELFSASQTDDLNSDLRALCS